MFRKHIFISHDNATIPIGFKTIITTAFAKFIWQNYACDALVYGESASEACRYTSTWPICVTLSGLSEVVLMHISCVLEYTSYAICEATFTVYVSNRTTHFRTDLTANMSMPFDKVPDAHHILDKASTSTHSMACMITIQSTPCRTISVTKASVHNVSSAAIHACYRMVGHVAFYQWYHIR